MSRDLAKMIIGDEILQLLEQAKQPNLTIYHNLSKGYDRLFEKKPKYIQFVYASNGRRYRETVRLINIERVLKTVGYEINDGYEKVRIVKPLYKLRITLLL